MMKIAVVFEKENRYFKTNEEDCTISYVSADAEVTPSMWGSYDAVFLTAPQTAEMLKKWTGHPHLRCVNSPKEITAELEVMRRHIELEKKYLVVCPDMSELEKYYPYQSKIEQVYLLSERGSHRVRKRTANGVTSFIETLKIRISGSKCFEYENRLTQTEYETLLKKADPTKHPIRKDRYCFVYDGQYFELDIYEFWKDKATLELELREENQPVRLPPEIRLIKDVSDDSRYKNNNLASIKI